MSNTGTSYLVYARCYKLMELTSAANGTYNKSGRKELISEKLVQRAWASDRNINDNNELYVFDEEKTDELDVIRQANKLKQSAVKTETAEDKLANAMIKAMGMAKAAPVEAEVEVDDLEDLKTIIKENDLGIRVAKTDTREKVEAKIKEAQK